MDERDVVDILQHYRHDLMNDLQIVYGYLSMGKIDNVKKKLNERLLHYNEERKLLSLGAAKFALWIIQFNDIYEHLHLNYQIHIESKQLHEVDERLVEQSIAIIDKINTCCRAGDQIEIDLELVERQNPERIEVSIFVNDDICELDSQKIKETCMKRETEAYVLETSNGLAFHIPILCGVRGEK